MDNKNELLIKLIENQGERLETIESLLSLSKTVLNIDEVCNLTGLSKSTIYKKTCKGEIKHYKQAKHLFFDRNEVEAWLKEYPGYNSAEISQRAKNFVSLNGEDSKI